MVSTAPSRPEQLETPNSSCCESDRRWPAHRPAAADSRDDRDRLRPGHRRHHRPAERPAALDPVEDVPEIRMSAEAVGLSSTEACGDVPGSSWGARWPASQPTRSSMQPSCCRRPWPSPRYVGSPAFSNLPRKSRPRCRLRGPVHPAPINDDVVVGVDHPELGAGYDLWAAAACRRHRCWASGWAGSCRRILWPTPGPG